MPLQLPSNMILAKNRLASTDPWLVFLDIDIKDSDKVSQQIINVVNNNEDIIWNGVTYYAYPFKIGFPKLTSTGDIPSIPLDLGNVYQVLHIYFEQYDGGIHSTVTLRVILIESGVPVDTPDLTMEYDVLVAKANDEWVHLTLGAPNPLRDRFPLERYIANHCKWKIGIPECGYVGELTPCERNLTACRDRENSHKFGGEIGLNPNGVRIVR